MFLKSDMSQLLIPGPRKAFRRTFPTVPTAGAVNAAGFDHVHVMPLAKVGGATGSVRTGQPDEVARIPVVGVTAGHIDIDWRTAPEARDAADLPAAEKVFQSAAGAEFRQAVNILEVEDVSTVKARGSPAVIVSLLVKRRMSLTCRALWLLLTPDLVKLILLYP